jgi:hypothetical protein
MPGFGKVIIFVPFMGMGGVTAMQCLNKQVRCARCTRPSLGMPVTQNAFFNFRFYQFLWDFKFSRRRVWCSQLSSGIYCRVKLLSTDVSEVRTETSVDNHFIRQYIPEDNCDYKFLYVIWSDFLRGLLPTDSSTVWPPVSTPCSWFMVFFKRVMRCEEPFEAVDNCVGFL